MPSVSRMSRRSWTAYAGSTTTASPVTRSPIRYTKFTIWRAIWSPRAKSRPDRSWRKYRPSSSATSLIVASPVIVCVGFNDGGQRIEPGYQLLDLSPRLTQASVQLVDQRGGSLQSRHQYVHVDLSLLKESDDRVELPTGVGVAQFLHGHWW